MCDFVKKICFRMNIMAVRGPYIVYLSISKIKSIVLEYGARTDLANNISFINPIKGIQATLMIHMCEYIPYMYVHLKDT